ncbi:MAG: hypothetical protein JNK49_18990 [Planctomycetes bacterium]|nr:hypothetical protein [Planctomycetota bacterium]
MRPLLVASLFAAAAISQADPVSALQSTDWRARNRAAQSLAAAPDAALDVAALVAVLRHDWNGPQLTHHRFGGRIKPSIDDVLDRVLAEAAAEVAGAARTSPWPREVVTRTEQLVVPWHPHQLVAFVLGARPALAERVAEALRELPLNSEVRVAVWLAAQPPELAALRQRAADGSDLLELAGQLWRDAARGRPLLTELVADAAVAWRRAVLDLGDATLLASPAAQQAALAQFLSDDHPAARRQAGFVLVQLGARAVPLVLPALTQPQHAPRVLALLGTLGEHAEGLGEELLPFLSGKRTVTMQRALAILARAPIQSAAQRPLASAAAALLDAGPGLPIRILAIDALANLGDGVDAALRTELRRQLDEPPGGGTRARLLGCLRRLQVPIDLPPERLVAICAMQQASDDTWLAAADTGAPALAGLAQLLLDRRHASRRRPVAARLAAVAPREFQDWLAHPEAGLRALAVDTLRASDAAAVPTARLAAMLTDEDPRVASGALVWISLRSDVAEHRAAILAAMAAHGASLPASALAAVCQRLGMSTAEQLAALSELLRSGFVWEAVRDGDPAVLRTTLRHWLGGLEEPAERVHLLAALVQLGLHDAEEIAWVRTALQGPRANALVQSLITAKNLPAALGPDLEALMDRGLAAGDPNSAAVHLGAQAREAMLRHGCR